MNARSNVMAPTDALRRLAQFLAESGNPMSPADQMGNSPAFFPSRPDDRLADQCAFD